jgi:SMC interacting uncharacterized protein involved in chromosome segregation
MLSNKLISISTEMTSLRTSQSNKIKKLREDLISAENKLHSQDITIKELKKELQERAIKLSGKKEDLINRLIIYYYNIQHQDL